MRLAFKADCILLKIQGSRGWPDRILLCPGAKIVFIEFKRPGEQLRPLQEFTLDKLRSMGFRAEMVNSVEQFKLILADTLRQPGSLTITNGVPSSGS